eukprot:CAMPEP_0117444190 /NCGR_PEP_ID=MMETSP0759-20121206/5105_1 /TAXON_ID=63605 /ORGANISM="Percolomonas cosmopolitus, Strain WS" /LENGTH=289 /DNA_ID=CAMNT_0005236233 /DNA_START=176 /DNA_END=1045 /DNA_ORIENTATION=-
MVKHLIKSNENHEVTIFDVNKDAYNLVKKDIDGRSVTVADSVADVAKNCNVVITMLPAPQHVNAVYKDMLDNVKPGQLYIDASTIDPQTTQDVAKQVESKGAQLMDAPVSGGVGGAAAGTLTFMVGGEDDAFNRANPLLKLMGKNIVHCGKTGMGQVAKIANNLVLGISMAAISEAMVMGTRLGMDPAKLANIFNTSSARCWSSDTYNPCPGVMENVPSSRNYEGGFASQLMLKDVGLAVTAAEAAKIPLPLGKRTQQLYKDVSEAGLGSKDFSVVFRYHNDRVGDSEL